MKSELFVLYKVIWRHTAATYVVAKSWTNMDDIKSAVRNSENRCDDIVGVEKVFLQAFPGDDVRDSEFVHVFLRDPIAL